MLLHMNLILLQSQDMTDEICAVVTDDRARHIRKVLKAELGTSLRVGLLNGAMGKAVVESIDRDSVVLQCAFDDVPPPRPKLDLLLAMPRPKVLKRMWAQLAALGVGRIVLVRAQKVERFYFDSHVLDPEFYNQRLIEGLQQARCTHLPEVLVFPLFKPFVEDELGSLFSNHLRLLADPSGQKGLSDFFTGAENAERTVLAIGPEGGWTPYELEQLQTHGFELFGMGKRILRTDTATIGLISMLADQLQRR